MALLHVNGITGLSTEAAARGSMARFQQGQVGGTGPFPTLRALSQHVLVGLWQGCASVAAPPHSEPCLHGSVACQGQTHGQPLRKIAPVAED